MTSFRWDPVSVPVRILAFVSGTLLLTSIVSLLLLFYPSLRNKTATVVVVIATALVGLLGCAVVAELAVENEKRNATRVFPDAALYLNFRRLNPFLVWV